ncbi:flagellar filament capping protein FliD [Paenibacillus sp. J2TS4]|uniref:flagellar filament capping protein FliD n=1 Tax=Paenibacillus sp. J2TS4 TaxID=2807194 RepID=UPI001AFEA67C|nr:flagellar filament capping protein FliD [Paenibacillus sp. J2TS4]GIP35613.1 flagellar hook-associated protein 2 [Paenibacillus sp. J2TS4]
MRINGFSGMDIDKMVKELMQAHRKPLDKLTQQKQTIEWQREKYREINSKLVDFRNNKLFNLNMNSTLGALKSTVTGNTAAVSAKAVSGSTAGSIEIQVESLASAARATGESIGTNINPNDIKLSDLHSGTIGEITINGAIIELSPDDTIQTVINKINNNKDAKVTAFFDSQSGRMSMISKETGKINTDGNISFGDNNPLVEIFKLNSFEPGTDASVTINGIKTTRSSNTFMVNGVEITLHAPTGTQSSMITTSMDADKVVDTIKSFIEDYNSLLKLLNDTVEEKKYRDFQPLTSDQKKELKEDDIKRWEEKAQSGLLRNDSILKKMISDLRLDIMSPVTIGKDADGNDIKIILDEVGITTGKWEDKGKLVLKDEAKLRDMLEKNPEDVIALFTSKGTPDADGNTPKNTQGIFQKMYDDVKATLDSLFEKAGTSRFTDALEAPLNEESVIGKELKSLDLKIKDTNRKLLTLENRYYRQFTAMEVAMNKFNAQSGFLMNAFGG